MKGDCVAGDSYLKGLCWTVSLGLAGTRLAGYGSGGLPLPSALISSPVGGAGLELSGRTAGYVYSASGTGIELARRRPPSHSVATWMTLAAGIRLLTLGAAAVITASVLAGCGGAANAQNGPRSPDILVGISLPLTGGFAADGQAFDRGYRLWQSDVNSHGGLLGRQVKLIIVNDNSDPNKTFSQYKQLIAKDHVKLTLGPFSSLLTAPAAEAVGPYHFAMIEGAGDAQNVFDDPKGDLKYHNVFSPSLPVADYMQPLIDWIKQLPTSQRPKTAAYPSLNDPFSLPAVQTAQSELRKAGIKTVYTSLPRGISEVTTSKQEAAAYQGPAEATASARAQLVVLGSTDVTSVATFMKVFERRHYVPKIFVASSGPDQGQAFEGVVGKANANGMMVPGGWNGDYQNALSDNMVEEYIANYGGTSADVNTDVAEAFSTGEVAADAVEHVHSTNNPKMMAYLHSKGVTLQTVQGPAKFNSLGENPDAVAFIFQWKNGNFLQVLPSGDPNSTRIQTRKTPWAG
jgi:branched-chain amino acid transport system substrate-binding protein